MVATLVRRAGGERSAHAVLYLHGWNDYFFQTHLADVLRRAGFDFYALDLRRYGRSLRLGQLPRLHHRPGRLRPGAERPAADLIAADHDQLTAAGPLHRRPDRGPVGRRSSGAGGTG